MIHLDMTRLVSNDMIAMEPKWQLHGSTLTWHWWARGNEDDKIFGIWGRRCTRPRQVPERPKPLSWHGPKSCFIVESIFKMMEMRKTRNADVFGQGAGSRWNNDVTRATAMIFDVWVPFRWLFQSLSVCEDFPPSPLYNFFKWMVCRCHETTLSEYNKKIQCFPELWNVVNIWILDMLPTFSQFLCFCFTHGQSGASAARASKDILRHLNNSRWVCWHVI